MTLLKNDGVASRPVAAAAAGPRPRDEDPMPRYLPLIERVCRHAIGAGAEGRAAVCSLVAMLAGEGGGHLAPGIRLGQVPLDARADQAGAGYAAVRLARMLETGDRRRDDWPVHDMLRSGRIGQEELRAATLIRWAAETGAGPNVPTIDPGRVVVDGGRGWRLEVLAAGESGDRAAVRRWAQALVDQGPLRGANLQVTRLDVSTQVVVFGDSPARVDRLVGKRHGWAADIVVEALRLFAKTEICSRGRGSVRSSYSD